MMAIQTQNADISKWDFLKWGLVAILIMFGIAANHYYQEIAWSLRLAAWIVLTAITFFVALQTAKGRQIWEFFKESRTELRRVVWPSREETIKITAVIIAMVIVMSLILWGIDRLLLWGVAWLTGQRG
jgi:preprotein translocase subunit SecE